MLIEISTYFVWSESEHPSGEMMVGSEGEDLRLTEFTALQNFAGFDQV